MIKKNTGIYMAIQPIPKCGEDKDKTIVILFSVNEKLNLLQVHTLKDRVDLKELSESIYEIYKNYSVVECIVDVDGFGRALSDSLKDLGAIVKDVRLSVDTKSGMVVRLKDRLEYKRFSVGGCCDNNFVNDFIEIIKSTTYNVIYDGYIKAIVPNKCDCLYQCLLLTSVVEPMEECTCNICGKEMWRKENDKYTFISKNATLYESENKGIDILCGTLDGDEDSIEKEVRISFDSNHSPKYDIPICKYCMIRILDNVKNSLSESLKDEN